MVEQQMKNSTINLPKELYFDFIEKVCKKQMRSVNSQLVYMMQLAVVEAEKQQRQEEK
jgi:hypothetical protein